MIRVPEVRPPSLKELFYSMEMRDKKEHRRLKKVQELRREGDPVPAQLSQEVPPVQLPTPTFLLTDRFVRDTLAIYVKVGAVVGSTLGVGLVYSIKRFLDQDFSDQAIMQSVGLIVVSIFVAYKFSADNDRYEQHVAESKKRVSRG